MQLLAYVQRMPDDLPVKVALNWRPEGGKGSRGRPKTFLLSTIMQDPRGYGAH